MLILLSESIDSHRCPITHPRPLSTQVSTQVSTDRDSRANLQKPYLYTRPYLKTSYGRLHRPYLGGQESTRTLKMGGHRPSDLYVDLIEVSFSYANNSLVGPAVAGRNANAARPIYRDWRGQSSELPPWFLCGPSSPLNHFSASYVSRLMTNLSGPINLLASAN